MNRVDRLNIINRLRGWASSAAYLAWFNLSTPLIGLVSSIVLTRLLSKPDYGSYAFFLSLILILDFTSLTGIGVAVIHSVARGYEGTLRRATRTRLLSSVLGASVLGLAAIYQGVVGNLAEAVLLACCGLAFPVYFPFTNFLYYLIGVRQLRRLASYQTYHLMLSYLPVFVAVLWTGDFRVALITHLVATPLARWGLYYRVANDVDDDAEADDGYLSYGKQLTLVGLFGSLEAHLDRIVMGIFFAPGAFATFHIGKTIGFQGRNIWNIAYQYIFPSLSRQVSNENRFPRALFAVLAIYLAAIAAIYPIVPWIVGWVYPSDYLDSAITARWFLLAGALAGPAAIFDTFFLAKSWWWAVWTVRLSKTLVYLALLYFLVLRFEIEGFYYTAVASAMLHSIVGAVLLFIGIRRKDEPKPPLAPGITGIDLPP